MKLNDNKTSPPHKQQKCQLDSIKRRKPKPEKQNKIRKSLLPKNSSQKITKIKLHLSLVKRSISLFLQCGEVQKFRSSCTSGLPPRNTGKCRIRAFEHLIQLLQRPSLGLNKVLIDDCRLQNIPYHKEPIEPVSICRHSDWSDSSIDLFKYC